MLYYSSLAFMREMFGFLCYEAELSTQSGVSCFPSELTLSKRVVVLPKCVSGSVTGLGHALVKLITKLSISDLSGVIFHWLSQ